MWTECSWPYGTHHLEKQPEKKGWVTLFGYPLGTLCLETSEEIPIHLTAVLCLVHQEPMLGLHVHPTNPVIRSCKKPRDLWHKESYCLQQWDFLWEVCFPHHLLSYSSAELLNELRPLNLYVGLSLPPPSPLQQIVGITLSFCPTAWYLLTTSLSSNTMNNLNKRSVAKKS